MQNLTISTSELNNNNNNNEKQTQFDVNNNHLSTSFGFPSIVNIF